jgi:dipeptide/tripeptide permease
MGGFLAQAYGYRLLFGLSGAGRLLSTLVFVRFVQEIRPRPSLQPASVEQP